MSKNKIIKIILIIILFLILIGFGAFLYQDSQTDLVLDNFNVNLNLDSSINQFPRRLDGVLIENEEQINPWVGAVMIDNMVDARPPAGLDKAGLVIECLAEANISRFLAFFTLDTLIDQLGPIRSARPYFAEWAGELQSLYIHSGGSPEALKNLKNNIYNVTDLNEFSWGPYFWRDWKRYAPHNLFTSSEKLNQFLDDQNLNDQVPNYRSWLYKRDLIKKQRPIDEQKIKIIYKEPSYMVEWQYDLDQNDYLRYQAGQPHLTADEQELRAKNVIIQYVEMEIIDYLGRKKIPTAGQGQVVIFQDGQKIEGQWLKNNSDERTLFYNQNDEEIQFNRGITWIEVVPEGYRVEY